MSKGVLLFAFNSNYDYYHMAEITAKRINHFLNLPTTIVTDTNSIPTNKSYNFDKTICVNPDTTNIKSNNIWINKGRHNAYELSPYDETLLLDVDYLINSNKLLQVFDFYQDYCVHKTTCYLGNQNYNNEQLSPYSFATLWATVIFFKKTNKAKQLFECLQMVEENYIHYSNIHGFIHKPYRNDYGLTLANRIVNGHVEIATEFIPWHLLHVGTLTTVYKNTNQLYNTEYTLMFDKRVNNKTKKEYMTISNIDFHVMSKDNFLKVAE